MESSAAYGRVGSYATPVTTTDHITDVTTMGLAIKTTSSKNDNNSITTIKIAMTIAQRIVDTHTPMGPAPGPPPPWGIQNVLCRLRCDTSEP